MGIAGEQVPLWGESWFSEHHCGNLSDVFSLGMCIERSGKKTPGEAHGRVDGTASP